LLPGPFALNFLRRERWRSFFLLIRSFADHRFHYQRTLSRGIGFALGVLALYNRRKFGMADRELLAGEELSAAVERAAKKKKLTLLSLIAVLLLFIAGGGTWFALNLVGNKDGAAAASQGNDAGNAGQAGPSTVAIYYALDPAFLANFNTGGRQHYLQLALTVKARNQAAIAALQTHMPLVRNRIVMLLSGEQFEQLQTDEGRQQLQQKLLTAIQEILTKETGQAHIEQVFFTNFVMQ
jgi:flagellar FliL protein